MNGIILFSKPAGITSFQALGTLKKNLNTGRVGHAGTLDKFASGLLIAAAGTATRLVRFFTAEDKEYLAEAVFGAGTSTLDPEGEVTATGPVPSAGDLERVLCGFRGEIRQRPPEYSAVHVNGERAWRAARRGETVVIKERPVRISALVLEAYHPPRARLRIACSSGTYIRALARDIAAALGTCAHLSALERVRIGAFTLAEAVSPSDFDPLRHLIPPGRIMARLSGMQLVRVLPGCEEHLRSGRTLTDGLFERPPGRGIHAVLDQGESLVAVIDRRDDRLEYIMVVPE